MTHPTDYFSHPRPESGQGLHTQESGDAGLSSNMKHKFSDDYRERALPVAGKGSFVIPIPKGEEGMLDIPLAGKIWSRPSPSHHAPCPKLEAHSVFAERWFLKPSTADEFPPQTTQTAQLEKNLKEGTAKVLVVTTAVTEEQPDEERGGEDCCIKMDTSRKKPQKPKRQPLVPGEGRNRKRTAVKNRKWYLLYLMAFIVPVSAGFSGARPAADHKLKSFTCMNKDRCPNLMTIFDSDDTRVYQGALNQTFPECCGISTPARKSCVVCRDQSNITIICSSDVRHLEVEDSDGGTIEDISPCELPQCRAHYGLILSFALIPIVLAFLVCGCCCKKQD